MNLELLDFENYAPVSMTFLANVAAGGEAQDAREVDRAPFLVTSRRCVAYLTSAIGADVAGTPLSSRGSSTVNTNQLPSAFQLKCKLELGDIRLFDQPTSLPMFGGYGDQDEIFPRPWLLPVKRNITLYVRNFSAVAVTVEMTLSGFKKLRA